MMKRKYLYIPSHTTNRMQPHSSFDPQLPTVQMVVCHYFSLSPEKPTVLDAGLTISGLPRRTNTYKM